MRYFFIFLFFFRFSISFSCECPALQAISKELCKRYDVIFWGMVDSVGVCGKDGISTTYFTIIELYKGTAQKNMKIDFDCASSCMMSFAKGEEWLVYSTYQKFDLLTVNICEHSRKLFKDETHDYYLPSAKRTFEQEKQFLQASFGIQKQEENKVSNKEQEEIKRHNEQPSGINKLWLLLISFAVMGIVFFVSRRKK